MSTGPAKSAAEPIADSSHHWSVPRHRGGSSLLGHLYGCLFDFRVHFSANQNGGTRQIEPQEKNNHYANGAIGDRETVEKAQIQFESKRDGKPKRNAHHRA